MKTWIKRTLYGLFGATLLVGGISACSHRHHGSGMAQWSAEDADKWRERVIDATPHTVRPKVLEATLLLGWALAFGALAGRKQP